MGDWQPMNEQELWEAINLGYERMTEPQRRLWNAIKVTPHKWQLHTWGDRGNGFWVVAILGQTVVWFNDIEIGFNSSPYVDFGTISEYRCNQDELQWQMQSLLDEVQTGTASRGFFGPPQPIE
jgi:hypothetical protein